MKKRTGIVMLALFAGMCTGTEVQSKSSDLTEEIREFTEIFKACYIAQDTVASIYMDSLEALEEYAEAPGEEKIQETIEFLTDAREMIDQEEIPECQFTIEIESFLEKRGLSMAEFEAFSAMGEADRQRYLNELDHYMGYLASFMEIEENISRAFLIELEYIPQIQNELNLYMYYATNEMLAALEEEEIAYIKEEVIEQLSSYNPEEAKWQSNKEDALQKQEECWTRIKAIQEKLESDAGKLLTEQ